MQSTAANATNQGKHRHAPRCGLEPLVGTEVMMVTLGELEAVSELVVTVEGEASSPIGRKRRTLALVDIDYLTLHLRHPSTHTSALSSHTPCSDMKAVTA